MIRIEKVGKKRAALKKMSLDCNEKLCLHGVWQSNGKSANTSTYFAFYLAMFKGRSRKLPTHISV